MAEENFVRTRRKIYAHELQSKSLNETRLLKVFVPSQIDMSNSDWSCPVLYCHDGNEFFTHGRIVTLATKLMETGELSPLIIVALAVNMQHRTDDYGPFGARHDRYVRFVMDEAVPFVEANFPVSRDVKNRFMAGISLGAAATLSIYLQFPDRFKKLLLFSGAYYEDQQGKVQAVSRCDDLNAFMAVGRQETAVETPGGKYNFYRLNQQMRDELRLRGAQVEYREADGTHIWGLWQSLIPESLRWVDRQISR